MGNPVRARVYYQIEEKICERGDYVIDKKMIPGYRNYFYKSAIWLTWKLPRSRLNLINSIRKWKWTHPGINYDQSKMDLDKRYQDYYKDYTVGDKKLKKYDIFHGMESTIYTQIKNKTGPSEIRVFFDDGKEIKIKPDCSENVLKNCKRF